MSKTLFENLYVRVTGYCGPALIGRDRRRIQFTLLVPQYASFWTMTIPAAKQLLTQMQAAVEAYEQEIEADLR